MNWIKANLLCLVTLIWATAAIAEAPAPQRTANGDVDDTYIKPADQNVWGAILSSVGLGNFEKSYALVIGISDFDHFNDLPTGNDPLRMRDYLIADAGFDMVVTLTGENATKARIDTLMEETFPDLVTDRDRFLFYWSGHGVTREIGAGEYGYLPLAGSTAQGWSSMIDMDDLRRWDRFLSARQVLYLLDSCFSGLAGVAPQSDSPRDISKQQLMGPSRHLLTAGTGEQQTIAIEALGGSVFTAALIDGLKLGAADSANGRFDADGLISVDELKVHVSRFVGFEAQRAGWTNPITPQLRELRANTGAFFFAVPEGEYGLRRVAQPPPPPPPEGGGVTGMGPGDMPPVVPVAEIRRYQNGLKELGLFSGAIDGELTLELEKAIGQFQGQNALTLTGRPNEETRLVLLEALLDNKLTDEPGDFGVPDDTPPEQFWACEDDCPLMQRVPGETFTMGAAVDGHPEEGPESQVTVQPFAMSTTEITQAQWLRYRQEVEGQDLFSPSVQDCFVWDFSTSPARLRRSPWEHQATNFDPQRPAKCISRHDAQGYVDWLSDKTGDIYRLPIEAELEYMMRSHPPLTECDQFYGALSGLNFPHAGGPCPADDELLAEVGTHGANDHGIADLFGSMWELSHNCWTDRVDAAVMANQSGPACSDGQVAVRGASFDDPPGNYRATIRQPVPVDRRQQNIGFRVVKVE